MVEQLTQTFTPTHLPNELSEFVSADYPPLDDKPVLVIRESQKSDFKYEVLTARYVREYRPLNPWIDMDGEAITASGAPVLGWKNAHRWLQPMN